MKRSRADTEEQDQEDGATRRLVPFVLVEVDGKSQWVPEGDALQSDSSLAFYSSTTAKKQKLQFTPNLIDLPPEVTNFIFSYVTRRHPPEIDAIELLPYRFVCKGWKDMLDTMPVRLVREKPYTVHFLQRISWIFSGCVALILQPQVPAGSMYFSLPDLYHLAEIDLAMPTSKLNAIEPIKAQLRSLSLRLTGPPTNVSLVFQLLLPCMTRLEKLCLKVDEYDDENCELLASCLPTTLENLELAEVLLDDSNVSLDRLRILTRLVTPFAFTSDHSLRALQSLKHLQLTGRFYDEDSAVTLPTLTNLRSSLTTVSFLVESDLPGITLFPNLRAIRMQALREGFGTSVVTLQHLPQLQSLDVTDSFPSIALLFRLTQLRCLSIRARTHQPHSREEIEEIGRMVHLQHLDLSMNQNWPLLQDTWTGLRSLTCLQTCTIRQAVSTQSFKTLLGSLPTSLKALQLRKCFLSSIELSNPLSLLVNLRALYVGKSIDYLPPERISQLLHLRSLHWIRIAGIEIDDESVEENVLPKNEVAELIFTLLRRQYPGPLPVPELMWRKSTFGCRYGSK